MSNDNYRFFLFLVLQRKHFEIADFWLIGVFEDKTVAFSRAEEIRKKGIDTALIPLIPDGSAESLSDSEVETLFHMFYGIGAKPYCGDSSDIVSILRYIE
ncbi:MAG: hypothetical protein J6B01_13655 [Ruminococcus sp.]|nr:hypothetical protein [Ruminococcus sp.]MBP3379390.1 hypothetical protein [Ruminococcus sp.]